MEAIREAVHIPDQEREAIVEGLEAHVRQNILTRGQKEKSTESPEDNLSVDYVAGYATSRDSFNIYVTTREMEVPEIRIQTKYGVKRFVSPEALARTLIDLKLRLPDLMTDENFEKIMGEHGYHGSAKRLSIRFGIGPIGLGKSSKY